MDSPAAAAPASSPVGTYGPLVHVSRFDDAPEELGWQLPINGELYRLMPGPDRPDYSFVVLRRPLHFYPRAGFDLERVAEAQRVEDRKGRPMVRVHALLVCARYVGQQLHPGMSDLGVSIAYVIDNSLAKDAKVDFAKIEYAGTGFLSGGHSSGEGAAPAPPAAPAQSAPAPAPAAPAPAPNPVPTPAPAGDPGTAIAREAAAVLRRGIEAHRGKPVERLTATLTLDEAHRLVGLTGNADGEAPEPTSETFARLNEVCARLGDEPSTADVREVRLRVGAGADLLELIR